MDNRELKQTIRRLKRLEMMTRYGFSKEYLNQNTSNRILDQLPLVWKEFFDLNNSNPKANYSFSKLERMDKEQLKQTIGEYWFQVYYKMYCENGAQINDVLPPELLSYLELPFDADLSAVKKRFRELYKTCHPDEGGDADKFIELMRMRDKYDIPR